MAKKDTSESVGKDVEQAFLDNPDINVQEVMEKFNISKTTAYRLRKKALAESGRNSNKDFDTYLQKHNTKLPPNLQGKLTEQEYWQLYHEDEEEGWMFHEKRGQVLDKDRSISFCGIVYADSFEEIQELMSEYAMLGIPFEWIWHDRDYWLHDSPEVKDLETGQVLFVVGERYKRNDPKKNHAHIMNKFDHVRTWQKNQQEVESIFGYRTTLWIPTKSINGMHNYITHSTEQARKDGKYPYGEENLHQENGFSVDLSKDERNAIYTSVVHYINYEMFQEYHRYEFSDLTKKFDGQKEMQSVMRGSAHALKFLLDSKRNCADDGDYQGLSDSTLENMIKDYDRRSVKTLAELNRRRNTKEGK